MEEELYLSDPAWIEFQRQKVFKTLSEFVSAMPPATKGVHTLPQSVAVQVEGFHPMGSLDERVACLMVKYLPIKVSANWNQITSGLAPSVIEKAKGCTVRLIRSNPKQGRWTFEVRSLGETYTVYLKASVPIGSTASKMAKLDLKLGCSCGFWKWQGPDYHASVEGYLDRKPRSNKKEPTVKDPNGHNKICKHVYACSQFFMKYDLPRKET